jgi:hypothetical protein
MGLLLSLSGSLYTSMHFNFVPQNKADICLTPGPNAPGPGPRPGAAALGPGPLQEAWAHVRYMYVVHVYMHGCICIHVFWNKQSTLKGSHKWKPKLSHAQYSSLSHPTVCTRAAQFCRSRGKSDHAAAIGAAPCWGAAGNSGSECWGRKEPTKVKFALMETDREIACYTNEEE